MSVLCKKTTIQFSLILLSTACLVSTSVSAAQLPPPTLTQAESSETTSFGTLYCNRAIIHWSNPSQANVTRYRVFINGRDGNEYVSYLANGYAGVTLYDDMTQTVQFASEDSTGEIGPLSNPLTVTTPPCKSPSQYKMAILMATFADFQNAPMPDNQPWTLDVVKNKFGVFTTGLNESFTIADWLKRVSYGKVGVQVDFFDEVILPGTMSQYCNKTLPNYGTILGYDCNTFQINQDAINANGGRGKFSDYQVIAVIAKGFGPVGISGITISAHGAHYSTYHPDGTPAYGPLLHEFYHSLNLAHHAAFRTSEGCFYPKDLSDITKNCTWDRYGGNSVMGAGVQLSPNADEVRRLGLLKKKQIVKITPQTGSQTVTLEPLNLQTTGVKQIQIQGTGSYWFPNTYVSLEYRRPTGINYRAGMKSAVYINLRADMQNNGTHDALTYQVGYQLTKNTPTASFPEWGIMLRLIQITAQNAVIQVDYI